MRLCCVADSVIVSVANWTFVASNVSVYRDPSFPGEKRKMCILVIPIRRGVPIPIRSGGAPDPAGSPLPSGSGAPCPPSNANKLSYLPALQGSPLLLHNPPTTPPSKEAHCCCSPPTTPPSKEAHCCLHPRPPRINPPRASSYNPALQGSPQLLHNLPTTPASKEAPHSCCTILLQPRPQRKPTAAAQSSYNPALQGTPRGLPPT